MKNKCYSELDLGFKTMRSHLLVQNLNQDLKDVFLFERSRDIQKN
ncbi:MAG: hypothetical protein ACPGLV_01375 [Bacteroidia bacterium]